MDKNETQNLKRSPIVVVVGHVDHGKTSLLDYIRKTNVVAKEAGGITQSIGAYEITHPSTGSGILRDAQDDSISNGHRITFIDTPGHEAFSKMRERGAEIADVAILVVAGDEGVKPQTKEAIQVLKDSKTPFIVAITKIDKPGADMEKVKKDLMAHNVFLEGFGGDVSFQGVSAKTGDGINELLDLILLTAEVENLTYNPEAQARGFILESKMDSRRGVTVSLILKDGKLKTGDDIATATAKGKIKIMENFLGVRSQELIPSSPAIILGFESLPQLGEEFHAGKLLAKELEGILNAGRHRLKTPSAKDASIIRLVLKADVAGSLEALNDLIKKIPLKENQKIEVLYQEVGEISDGDVKDAVATNAVIIGFRTYPNKAAENLARNHNITIVVDEIIYKLIENIEVMLESIKQKVEPAELEVLAIFSSQGQKQTVGGRVVKNPVKNKMVVEIRRADKALGKGRITTLQQKKSEVNVVNPGNECGLQIESNVKIEVGDKLVAVNL